MEIVDTEQFFAAVESFSHWSIVPKRAIFKIGFKRSCGVGELGFASLNFSAVNFECSFFGKTFGRMETYSQYRANQLFSCST